MLSRRISIALLLAATTQQAGAQKPKPDVPLEVVALRSEAKSTLRSIFAAQKAHFAEKDAYGLSFTALEFSPPAGNRYTYFLAPKGALERRDGKSARPTDPVIVGVDETKHVGVKLVTDLLATECPVTTRPGANGVALPVGVSGVAPDQDFVAVAAGNLDTDAELDCWSIASFDRKAKDGTTVPAGSPLHEKSDVPNLK